jgi:hypothetical protein
LEVKKMAEEKKGGNGRVVVFLPVIPLLPSGVVDMGTITRLVSEADLANNPPEEGKRGEDTLLPDGPDSAEED